MESVLSGFVMAFLLIFGILTFARAGFGAQAELLTGWQSMHTREQLQHQTRLAITQAYFTDNGMSLVVVVENQGESRFTSFYDWDMIIQYDDDGVTPQRRLAYFSYTSDLPTQNEWTLDGLFMSNPTFNSEVFELGIFNPGESARLVVHLGQPVGENEALQVIIGLPMGSRLTTMLLRNSVPVLVANTGLAILNGATGIIPTTALSTTDNDHDPEDLVYVIVTAPTQGTLSLPHTFTQAQIDAGLLTYTHTGTGSDSFQFSVTDGVDVIGIYTFLIAIS